MKKQQDVKISSNLAWLCREHYNGLLVVCTIRRAIRNLVADSKIDKYIETEFFGHLDKHFREEEAWLFPKLAATNALRIQAEKQHDKLRKMAASQGMIPEEFANLLEEHIRFEERTLFPVFAKIMNDKSNCALA